MYAENSNFTSDLVNSYAWDTAITFLQTFDNRAEEAKTKPYSRQNSLNSSFAEKGTNQLETKDIICNIYDMASNMFEWSTETYSSTSNPCVIRGGGLRQQRLHELSRHQLYDSQQRLRCLQTTFIFVVLNAKAVFWTYN